MLLVPYRSKSAPESFPYATIALIAINVVVYGLTSESFLFVRKSAMDLLAVSHSTVEQQPFRVITAMFLHGSLPHILGNMLFLGVFGPGAEGRLRTAKFLMLYFLAGIVGWAFDDLVSGFGNPERFSLGASGAIMGVVGMYLYMFPHAKILVFFLGSFRGKSLQWKAAWIIAFYIFFDIWYSITQTDAGVGHLCHLAGVAVGFLGAMMLGAKHDDAKETLITELRAESGGNFQSLPLPQLAVAYQSCPEDGSIAMAYCAKAAREGGRRVAIDVMRAQETRLLVDGNPEELAMIILGMTEYDGPPPPWLTHRLATRFAETDASLAEPLCRRLLRTRPYPTGELLEQTLMQLACVLEKSGRNTDEVIAIYRMVILNSRYSDAATQSLNRLKELGEATPLVFSVQEGKAINPKSPASFFPAA